MYCAAHPHIGNYTRYTRRRIAFEGRYESEVVRQTVISYMDYLNELNWCTTEMSSESMW
ncbi:hypothetical protein [Methermicoccus shengliensis]|uniref:Uncharacterized protein n=1 Tax=Methermicoccus shengliensis TaxID=660064 RepID=A0A832RW13_9EURY|nr:hypothetical protein [Methermicoccus shengliensis]KUK04462.1 MAG: hypothetical protein XD46_0780 [Euryarchaeota archaeon 55_53]KUK30089.1 MAG: hypothetical protein XD62_0811 [Methanosarcinales archeaon 56_1174]MDI3487495.1 hypothetical protein [Methanosarcinales archaeon]HIH69162.1 hypothetical protein [Methermicoccus shengliensis]